MYTNVYMACLRISKQVGNLKATKLCLLKPQNLISVILPHSANNTTLKNTFCNPNWKLKNSNVSVLTDKDLCRALFTGYGYAYCGTDSISWIAKREKIPSGVAKENVDKKALSCCGSRNSLISLCARINSLFYCVLGKTHYLEAFTFHAFCVKRVDEYETRPFNRNVY